MVAASWSMSQSVWISPVVGGGLGEPLQLLRRGGLDCGWSGPVRGPRNRGIRHRREGRGLLIVEGDASEASETITSCRRFVREWAGLHRDELLANWERARNLEPLEPIGPLPQHRR
jgi:hypothetical protein